MQDDLLQPLLLDLPPLQKPDYTQGSTLRQKWWAFHCANTHVYAALRAMALALKARGIKKVGIALLWERLRWEVMIRTNGDPYKLGNSYRAFYARFLMDTTPELKGFFEIRYQPSQEGDEVVTDG